jgi:hypothetical protein
MSVTDDAPRKGSQARTFAKSGKSGQMPQPDNAAGRGRGERTSDGAKCRAFDEAIPHERVLMSLTKAKGQVLRSGRSHVLANGYTRPRARSPRSAGP